MSGKTKQAVLLEKAQNFRTYINDMKPSDVAQSLMSGFNEALLIPSIVTHILPAHRAGTLGQQADLILANLEAIPPGKETEVRTKVLRYLECFAVLGSQ